MNINSYESLIQLRISQENPKVERLCTIVGWYVSESLVLQTSPLWATPNATDCTIDFFLSKSAPVMKKKLISALVMQARHFAGGQSSTARDRELRKKLRAPDSILRIHQSFFIRGLDSNDSRKLQDKTGWIDGRWRHSVGITRYNRNAYPGCDGCELLKMISKTLLFIVCYVIRYLNLRRIPASKILFNNSRSKRRKSVQI